MTKERNALKAGIFMLVCLGLIIFTIGGIKGMGRITDPEVTRQVTFELTDNVAGLRLGDDVRIGGLRVGVIKTVEFLQGANGKQQHIVVTFTMPGRIPIKKDAHVQIESTITGAANLNIDNLGAGAALTEGDKLVGSPSALATVMAAAGVIAPEIGKLVNDVHTQTLPKVNGAVDKYSEVAGTGKDALGQIRDFFGESKTDFKGTLANLNTASGSVKDKLPGILEKIDNVLAKSHGTIDSINASLEDVKQTVANTRDITAKGRSIIAGNKSKIDAMIASLKTTGDNLKFASSEIRRSPWRLIYKPGPGEVANLNLYDTARQFAEGANDLSEASTALRDAIKDPNTEKEKVEELVQKLDRSFAKFSEVESELWKEVKQ